MSVAKDSFYHQKDCLSKSIGLHFVDNFSIYPIRLCSLPLPTFCQIVCVDLGIGDLKHSYQKHPALLCTPMLTMWGCSSVVERLIRI